jgi:hypothetical protein
MAHKDNRMEEQLEITVATELVEAGDCSFVVLGVLLDGEMQDICIAPLNEQGLPDGA